MPNRKKDIGWYLLPKSGTPYHGPIPEGAKTLTDAEAKRAVKNSGEPVATKGDGDSGDAKS